MPVASPVASYTILFRRTRRAGRTALIVEDESGERYLCRCYRGRCHLTPLARIGAPPALFASGWSSVPRVEPYTLDSLHHLMTGAHAPRRHHGVATPPARARHLARATGAPA